MDLDEYSENIYDAIVTQIRKTREVKGITKKKIAEDLGLNPVTYADMEKGKTKFSAPRLFAVMKYLQITPSFSPDKKIQSYENQARKCYSILKEQQSLLDKMNSKILKLKEENYQQAKLILKLEKENLEIKDLIQEMLNEMEEEL